VFAVSRCVTARTTSEECHGPTQAGSAAAAGPRFTVIETQGFNLLVTDNTANKLYYYTTDKDAAVGSPLKLRASLDLTQLGKEEIAIKGHNLENMKTREKK
jgi:hypothetical protein